MGGIGKTQLAITYAKEYHSLYTSIFWLNANSKVSICASLRAIAHRIVTTNIVGQMDDDQVRICVSNWLSEQDNARWLLIYDNFDNPDEYDIKTYFPAVGQGSIIITTRQPRAVNGHHLRVRSMKEMEDGLQILATRSQRDSVGSGTNILSNRFS